MSDNRKKPGVEEVLRRFLDSPLVSEMNEMEELPLEEKVAMRQFLETITQEMAVFETLVYETVSKDSKWAQELLDAGPTKDNEE